MSTDIARLRSFILDAGESIAARMLKEYNPKADRLTQRQAFLFFKKRDTEFGGEFRHDEAWVRRMVKEKKLHPQRIGKCKNSPLYYSKTEMYAVYAASIANEKKTLKGIL